MADERIPTDPAPVLSEGGERRSAQPPAHKPQIKGYQILAWVGEGGMGTVWKAVQLSTKRTVALKLISPAFLGSGKARQRFEREVELAASLEHPNIARVYDSGLREGVYCYAMEFIDGHPLDAYVLKGRLSQVHVLQLIHTVCQAVHHAHRVDIIHTDLKPTNVVVDVYGQPHVLDFGLAKSLRQQSPDPDVSLQGEVLGTPAYMSPEQAQGHRRMLVQATDVYSIGAILYRLLTGVLPHSIEGSFAEVLHRIADEDVKHPSEVCLDVDENLSLVLLKALAREPARRYLTAGALAEDIQNYLSGAPLTARVQCLTPTATEVRNRDSRRQPTSQELHQIEALLSSGDAEASAGRWQQAQGTYADAAKRLEELGCSSLPADVSLLRGLEHCMLEIWRIDHNPGNTQSTAFSVDGRLLLTGGEDGRLVLWDVQSGRELRQFSGHRGSVRCIAFSSGGKVALSGSSDKMLRLWDVNTGRLLQDFAEQPAAVTCVAWFQDGSRALSGGEDGLVRLWDVRAGSELLRFKGHRGSVRCLAISPDERLVLSGGTDGTIRLWDTDSGRRLLAFSGHKERINAVAFSPDGRRVVSGSMDRTVRLWETLTGRALQTFLGHPRNVKSVAFSPDGEHIISGSDEGDVRVWSATTGHELRNIAGAPGEVRSMAFSSDTRLGVLCDAENTLRVGRMATSNNGRVLTGHQDVVRSLAISADGQLVLSGGVDKTLRLWDAATGHELQVFRGHTDVVNSVSLSDSHRYALSGGADHTMRLWETATGRQIHLFPGHRSGIRTVAFSPDERLAVSGSWDRTVRLWEVEAGHQRWVSPGQTEAVNCVAFSPDGRLVLTGGGDNTVRLWQVATGRELRAFFGHSDPVKTVTFSHDGSLAISGGVDKTLRVWEVATGRELHSFASHRGVRVVGFSADGQWAASGCRDNTVRFWHLATGDELRSRFEIQSDSELVMFSLDGQLLATTKSNGEITLWDLRRPGIYRSLTTRLASAKETLASNPNDASALNLMAEWYEFHALWEWAVEFYQRASDNGASISPLRLARCFWQIRDAAGAQREFQRAAAQREAQGFYLELCLSAVKRNAVRPLDRAIDVAGETP